MNDSVQRDLFIRQKLAPYLIENLARVVDSYSTFSLKEGILDLASKSISSEICVPIELAQGSTLDAVHISQFCLLITVMPTLFGFRVRFNDGCDFPCGVLKSFDFLHISLVCGGDQLRVFAQKYLPSRPSLVMNFHNLPCLSAQVWMKLRKQCTSEYFLNID